MQTRRRSFFASLQFVRRMSAVRALVPIAHGSEEIEFACIADTLRRAGMHVTVAALTDCKHVDPKTDHDPSFKFLEPRIVTMSRLVRVVADTTFDHVLAEDEHFDIICLPGGARGAENFRDSEKFVPFLKSHMSRGGWTAALCASPAVVLAHHGLLSEHSKATSHPSVSSKLPNQEFVDHRVVVDGKLITSRGPGTSLEFALEIVRRLVGVDTAENIKNAMLVRE
ncbi:conserved mitochondrial intracellular protease/amidase [Andalucia godoyi]|uniref:Conserved mitochondrial intracellular protease/amidase n=1 Tax=Andalucia godoyi TaxID=505711 RepID=A0A8K0AHX7_ANDGO|nr:conserved mitochondrial intracellular protease/amidase [Andalucia godoyi]|eukprot:ANDGO_03371.mRNA.1 conserved mitochondrial intracellular protease/amidase